MSDKEKQLKGKHRFHGRVDVSALIEPVAELRKVIIEDIEKYPESMEWPSIPPFEFVDAIQRHLNKIYEAGDPFALDKETGLPHIHAIGFNRMVLEMKRKKRNKSCK